RGPACAACAGSLPLRSGSRSGSWLTRCSGGVGVLVVSLAAGRGPRGLAFALAEHQQDPGDGAAQFAVPRRAGDLLGRPVEAELELLLAQIAELGLQLGRV